VDCKIASSGVFSLDLAGDLVARFLAGLVSLAGVFLTALDFDAFLVAGVIFFSGASFAETEDGSGSDPFFLGTFRSVFTFIVFLHVEAMIVP